MKKIFALILGMGLFLSACGTTDGADPDMGMTDPDEDNEELTSEDEDGVADGDQATDINDGPDESGEDPDKPQDRDGEEGTGLTDQDAEWDNDVNEMKREAEGGLRHGVVDFELEIDFENDQGEWQFDYEVKQDGKKAKVEIDQDQETDRKGKLAVEEIEAMIDNIKPKPDLSKEEAFQRVYNHLEIMEEEVLEIELDIDFDDGDTLEVSHHYS
ncbi:YusW family protein [Alkalibacillus sp. S2W]|uniref:YusW family protein n=1 Tax=Alkalibacillus sp. S2W TaxID=3386553 RepID=UPI00398CEBC0